MKKIIKKVFRYLLLPFVLPDYIAFKKITNTKRFSLSLTNVYPQIKDKTITTGFDRHYVYHTAWAIRKVKEINPATHIDISSTLYFSTTLSAFIPVEFYDYRPAHIQLSNLKSKEGNLMKLPFADNSVQSLSCMHTIEHIGLGRYGDPLDPDGDLKAIKELIRVLAPGGSLLFVTPIGGSSLIEFNAHRIYRYTQIQEYFKELSIEEFSLIPEHEEDGGIIINASEKQADLERYGCGCFHFKKKC